MTKTSIYKTELGKIEIMAHYEQFLQKWPQPNRQHFINTSLGETFVVECGNPCNKKVVLLHGSASNSAMWLDEAEKLSEKYHVFAIDIIGECGKSVEKRPKFHGNVYSNWLREVLRKLEIYSANLIACSLGGWIALDFAIKHPTKVEKLVLMAAAGLTQVKIRTIFWIIVTSFFGDVGFRMLNKMVYGGLEIDEAVLTFSKLINQHYKPRTDVLPIFPDKELKKIKAPTLFIGGEYDCFYNSKKSTTRITQHITNSECNVLEYTRHVLLNQADRILQYLEKPIKS